MQPEQQGAPEGADGAGEGPGIVALSLPARIVVAIAVAVVTVVVAVHLAMVFLHVAPENTVTKQHGEAVQDYVLPEFEQNWKLFAPNPLQQNIAVQARAQVARQDGTTARTGWWDLSAQDGAGVRHSLAPSHTQQNELRRGWEFFSNTHDSKGKPVGTRGELSERYIKRIVLGRIGAETAGGTVERVQVRSAVTPVAPPPWSDEKYETKTEYRAQPWWQVSSADIPGGGK
ncbi:DUF5819 family protein [Streptomyces sp. ODS28]|uniref:DUF5819 family protein n=1 Tax=Streptomyces sp. ODS28 TaxID=3136688 RepID=UPI0031E7C219